MPDDFNTSMDERLRRMAQERRAAAPPVELHDVNRRLLQDEVKRVHGSPASANRGAMRGWLLWGPRLAWGASLAAFVGLVALVVRMPPGRESGLVSDAATTNIAVPSTKLGIQTRSEPAPSSTLADAPRPAAAVSATPPAAVAPAPLVGPGEQPAQPTMARRYGLAAPKLEELASTKRLDVAIAPSPAVSAPAPVSEVAKAAPLPVDASTAKMKVAASAEVDALTQAPSQNLRFQQVQAGAERRRNYQSPRTANVLQSFEMIQTGNQVRLVDADGSVYAGEWSEGGSQGSAVAPDSDKFGLPQLSRGGGTANAVVPTAGGGRLDGVSQAAAAQNQSAGVANSFRAIGLNRTLNQQVEITGTLTTNVAEGSVGLLARPQAPAASAQGVAGNSPSRENQQRPPVDQLQLGQPMLQGRVVIGGSNRFDVQAVPVKR